MNHHPAPSFKNRLARWLHPIERWIDRIKTRAPKDPVIQGYLGYSTPQNVILRGRVLSRMMVREPSANDSRFSNFRAMLRLFGTDEVPNIAVATSQAQTMTDEEGYFTLSLPVPDQAGWASYDVFLPEQPNVQSQLQALVPDKTAAFGIISDVDDTILETGAYSLVRNLWTSLTGSSLTRHVFPDAQALIQRLHDGKNPVFYVSSSPWNMFDFLQQVFARNNVHPGPMFLRDLGLSDTQFITGTHGGHKGAAIDTILQANPDLPFVLIGDTGQEDAHVYLAAFHRHPDRIFAVVLREPGPGPDRDSLAAIADMKAAGLTVQTGRDFTLVTVTSPQQS